MIIQYILLLSVSAIFCLSTIDKVDNGIKLSFDEMLDLYIELSQKSEDKKLNFLQINQERFQIFAKNVEEIIAHNANTEKTYTKGVNKFTDLTDEEFMKFYVASSQNCSATLDSNIPFKYKSAVPIEWDWRNFSVVSPVKNQRKCGSCWTFSSTGAIESHYSILNRVTPPDLSEQQLVDCAGDFDNHGCHGGLPSHAFEYIRYNSGLEFESTYPYEAKDKVCRFNRTSPVIRVPWGSYNITMGNEVELREAVFEFGPVSITYQVVSDFRHYKKGVYESKECKNSTLDVNHAVLAVGYGVERNGTNTTDYWVVKNSWGADWGDHGYFKIKRGVNMCGVAVCNSFPKMAPK